MKMNMEIGPVGIGCGTRGADHARRAARSAGLVLAIAVRTLPAADLYVAVDGAGDGTSPASPTNSLQGAIDAISGAYVTNTVWVDRGVYNSGGRTNWPSGTVLSNRVVINKVITVRSLHDDPANTVIMGQWDPVATNGPAAVRCVYLSSGARLIGFTLTNGATLGLDSPTPGTSHNQNGGGTWTGTTATLVSNCIYSGNSAAWSGGGAYYGTLKDCLLTGNRAGMDLDPAVQKNNGGGGACYAGLVSCLVISNSANEGGGADSCTMTNCSLIGNLATRDGGGANGGYLTNCLVLHNTSLRSSGGTYYSYLENCRIISNAAPNVVGNCGGSSGRTFRNCTFIGNSGITAGAVINGTLYNCLLMGNYASYGGGAYASTLYNCTVVGNETRYNGGGGVYASGPVINSIVYDNKAPNSKPNWHSSGTIVFSNTCTYPNQAGWDAGNTTNNPRFRVAGSGFGTADFVAGDYTLRPASPCVNQARAFGWMSDPALLSSRDLNGNARIDKYSHTPDMGCYEYMPGGVGTVLIIL